MATKAASGKAKAVKPKASPKASRSPAKAAWSRSPRKKGSGRRSGTAILHSCGHRQTHRLVGLKWKKDREKVRLAEMPCRCCWAAAKAEEVEAICDLHALPILTGTEKQVLWARSLRAQAILKIQNQALLLDRECRTKQLEPSGKRFLDVVVPFVLKQKKAKWWIDSREVEEIVPLLVPEDVLNVIGSIWSEVLAVSAPMEPESDCPF